MSNKRAVFYVVSRDSYIAEVKISAASVKEHLGLETILCTVVPTKSHPSIDRVIMLPKRKHDLWYLDRVEYMGIIAEQLKDYDQLLCLDSDTYVCRPCIDMFRLLEYYEIALGHAAGRDVTISALKVPPSWTTLGMGVLLFRNDDKVRAFFGDWLDIYKKYKHIYHDTDEAPLRDVMYENTRDMRLVVLPPEYHMRFGFGCWMFGWVRILHGRVKTPLEEIAKRINAENGMRVWKGGRLMWYWRSGKGDVYPK